MFFDVERLELHHADQSDVLEFQYRLNFSDSRLQRVPKYSDNIILFCFIVMQTPTYTDM
jgi:hypothetical protein